MMDLSEAAASDEVNPSEILLEENMPILTDDNPVNEYYQLRRFKL